MYYICIIILREHKNKLNKMEIQQQIQINDFEIEATFIVDKCQNEEHNQLGTDFSNGFEFDEVLEWSLLNVSKSKIAEYKNELLEELKEEGLTINQAIEYEVVQNLYNEVCEEIYN